MYTKKLHQNTIVAYNSLKQNQFLHGVVLQRKNICPCLDENGIYPHSTMVRDSFQA